MRLVLASFALAAILLTAQGANAATTTCGTVAACVFGANTDSGYGVEGSSKANDGVVGVTLANTTSSTQAKAGVVGFDDSTNRKGLNSGVFGMSPFGNGVQGKSTSGYGVSGISTSGHGVDGASASGFGVVGSTDANATSTSTTRAGVLGEDNSTNNAYYRNSGVAGVSLRNGYGVSGSTLDGDGVYGEATAGGYGVSGVTDASGVGGAFFESALVGSDGAGVLAQAGRGIGIYAITHADGPAAYLETDDPKAGVLIGVSDGTSVVSIDSFGNEILAGSLTTAGSPISQTRTSTGTPVASYGTRASSPVLEDFGKAELRNGTAYVALDRTFATTIDPRSYMVFITPEGDSNSLFTRIGNGGFFVRESKGGRSSLAFDYRIVAKPLDAVSAHLPAMAGFPKFPKHMPAPKFEHRG